MTHESDAVPPAAPRPSPGDAALAAPRPRRPWWRTSLHVVKWAVLAVLAFVLILALAPVSTSGLASDADPAMSYDEAVQRFEEYAAQESAVYGPCASRLLTHGETTDVAVVLVHGLTNCPKQFVELGEEIHATGANVLILRMPYHGLAAEDGTVLGL